MGTVRPLGTGHKHPWLRLLGFVLVFVSLSFIFGSLMAASVNKGFWTVLENGAEITIVLSMFFGGMYLLLTGGGR